MCIRDRYSNESEIEEALLNLYVKIGGARKRAYIASPVLVEIGGAWYVTPLPTALGAIRSAPHKLATAAIINGFNVPILVVRDLQPSDLGTPNEHARNVDWLHSRLTMAEASTFGELFSAGGEYESPV